MRDTQQLTRTTEQEAQQVSGFDTYSLWACLAISGFLIAWITVANHSFNFRSAIFLLLLPWILRRAGGIVSAALRLPSFFALDLLLGVAVLSVAIMAWKIVVPLSLWMALVLLLIAIAWIPRLLPHHQREPLSVPGFLAVITSLVAATAWSQDLLVPTNVVGDTIAFKPWSDFFFHASIVARSLESRTLLQTGNYEWQGFPAFFYHYASYSLSSALSKVSHVSAYVAVTGFWTPFGSFLSGLAAYALGRSMWNDASGLASLAATSLIPDGALLNIAHPTYGYFWLQHISPAGLYGVAIAGTALLLIAQGARAGRRLWIASGALLAALTVFFKVQIFLAAFPLLLCFAILGWPPRSHWRWLVAGSCVAAGVAFLPLANRSYVGPNVQFNFSSSDWYWNLLANMARGTYAQDWYRVFSAGHPFPSHLAQAIGLLLVSALGTFAVVAPLVWLLAAWHKSWQTSEGISVAAVAVLLVMTFGLSRSGTAENVYELIQRPFVWAYWLVGSLAAGRLFSMISECHPRLWTRAMMIGVIVLTALPMCYGSGLQHGKWPGGDVHSGMRVDRGLVDCARYIRSQPPINALAQDSHLDKAFILVGLAERPSFAARPEIWRRISKSFRESPYQEQLQKLQRLQQAANIADLQRSVRETGIRWYVVHPDDLNLWPAEFRDRPKFESAGYRVYELESCFDLSR